MNPDRRAPARLRVPALSLAFALAAALAACSPSRDEPAATAQAPAPAPAASAASALGSGAGSGAPTAPSIAPASPDAADSANVAAARTAPPEQPTAGTSATPAGSASAGQHVFATACVTCHGAGVAGAPRLGEAADWKPRIAQGKEVLYQHALQGYTGQKGVMPPKGGNTALADADVRSAVDYMVAQVP